MPMKEQYTLEIIERLEHCNDVALLDLIVKLLDKSI